MQQTPNKMTVRVRYGYALLLNGDAEKALTELQAAEKLQPTELEKDRCVEMLPGHSQCAEGRLVATGSDTASGRGRSFGGKTGRLRMTEVFDGEQTGRLRMTESSRFAIGSAGPFARQQLAFALHAPAVAG